MAALQLVIFSLACLYVYGLPNPPVTRNTIFLDEKLEGQIFEKIDAFSELSTDDIQKHRLPTTTKPISYNVFWMVDMTALSFFGNVAILIEATQANVDEIVIHAHDMTIGDVVLEFVNGATVAQTYTLDPNYHFLRIKLTNDVLQYNKDSPVQYTLKIAFNSKLRDDMYGIYQTWFRNNPNEDVRWMASTQFQATAARFAFPCYDEPSFKATFDVTIRRPNTHRSWFCTTIVDTGNPIPNYTDDIYATTPIMSTYLLALIVADYESLKESVNAKNYYEVIARPGALNLTDPNNLGRYALDTGRKLTEVMNVHTDINYFDMHENLVKMTHAAVPDFSAGAMENWGLITYREAYLMYDANNSNDHSKQIIAYILSHEIAHMWFGNLVTCDFWDNLWLNEGFARYYQYYLTHEVEEEMGFSTRFIPEQVHTSLLFDSSENAHALTHPVGSAASVRNMFSTISYNKGAAVIRMTEHLLGTKVHEAGLRNYLKDRSFQTAKPIHLFQALQDAAVASGAISQYSNFSVVDYYKTWTEQNGHPLVFVDVNHRTGQMIVTQRRFSINTGYATRNLRYIIPITFYSAVNPDHSDTKPSHILTETSTVINRGSVGDHWVIFNKQQTGFYRVNYDDYTWDLIIIALRGPSRKDIHEFNRAQIVNDVFQFARAGLMTYNRAFNILSFLKDETDYTPWVAAVTGFSWLQNRLAGTVYQSQLENLIIQWAAKVMEELKYSPTSDESFMRSYLRYQLAPLMCRLKVDACLQSAKSQFEELQYGKEVTVNSRSWVYCNALRQGGKSEFDFLWDRYLNENVYTEKILILQNIGCTPDATSLNSFLTSILKNNTEIRPQDYSSAFNSALTGNEGNTKIVLEYIQNNVEEVLKVLQTSALTNTIARLRTNADLELFQTWATNNKQLLGDDVYESVTNSVRSTQASIQWHTTIQKDLEEYFLNEDVVINTSSTTSAPVTVPSTVTAPPLVEPSTPSIPDSAITSTLSVIALTVAFIVNFIV
ncbi:membrane alanyl aminopeptidase [Bicyclus anynana]|uniref:Aminopeptidase n=1 Tax=Bicyclus anynana TaxID=110368 RepID=A0ABM3LNW1_BICAN|nr:membrane alanyl aminopeptidase [Bicyclus anynana]